jgi:hypothetical protein
MAIAPWWWTLLTFWATHILTLGWSIGLVIVKRGLALLLTKVKRGAAQFRQQYLLF